MKKKAWETNCIYLSIISVIVFFICATTPVGNAIKQATGNLNLSSMALCIVLYLALIILFGRKEIRLSLHATIMINVILLLFLIFSLLLEHMVFDAPSHLGIEFSSPLYLFVMVVLTIFLCSFFSSKENRFPRMPKVIQRILFIGLTAVIVGITIYNQYTPNVLQNSLDSHHFTAYVNSIWNIFWGQPYTTTITSIYGHYGFLYYPFLKIAWLLGARDLFKAYFYISAFMSAACIVMFAISLSSLVKNTGFRLLGLLGIGYINCARITTIYHQLFPHRMLPMAVSALMMTIWMHSRRKMIVNIIGYVICIALTIWSTEYGLFSTIAWSALNCCFLIQTKRIREWFAAAIHILAIPATFIASLLVCGWLNTLMGGSMLTMSDFIFPLANHGYMHGFLEVPLPAYPAAWMSIMAGLLVFLGMGMSDTVICCKDCQKNERTAMFFGLAVLGLGSVTYAINRAAYGNFYIIMYLMAIIMAVIAESGADKYRDLFQGKTGKDTGRIQTACFCFASLCALTIIAMSCVINVPNTVNREVANKDEAENTKLMAELRKYSDGDAYAVGNVALSAFAMLGWDPQVYLMDLPDINLNPAAVDEMVQKMGDLYGKELFISFDDFGGPLPASYSSAYKAVKQIHIGPHTILYCKPVQLLRRNPRAKMAK